jgi:hypothetical protein
MNLRWNSTLIIVTLLLAACMSSKSASPTTAPQKEIELLGHIGGVTEAILAHGDFLYAGFGSELAILDISNPTSPERTGYVTLRGVVKDISVTGQYAYVYAGGHRSYADSTGQLSVIDISDPTAPFEIGHVPASAEVVELVGHYAYITQWNKLSIIDASNPETPVQTEVFSTTAPINGIVVADDQAYIGWGICYRAACTRGMTALDVSDPTAPEVTGSSETVSFARPVASVGHYLYAALEAIDVSQPAEPVSAGRWLEPERRPTSIAVAGDRMYVVDDQGTLIVLDVSEPGHPVEICAHPILRSATSAMAVTGDPSSDSGRVYAYAANGDTGGLSVIDISNPEAFVQIGQYNAPGKAADLAVVDGYAYIANSDGDYWIVDVSDSVQPTQANSHSSWVQSYPAGGHVAVAGGYFFIANWESLQILDVSEPHAPELVRILSLRSPISALAALENHLYVATIDDRHSITTSCGTLWVLDVSEPDTPRKVGKLELEEDFEPMRVHLSSLSVAGNYVYATSQAGLWVIDVSDPTNPTKVGVHDTPGVAASGAVANGYAYIADGFSGLRAFDVSEPATAAEVGYHGISAYSRDVAAGQGYVYVVNDAEGLWAFDISNPAAPTRPRNFFLPGQASIAVVENTIYLLDETQGLFILQ